MFPIGTSPAIEISHKRIKIPGAAYFIFMGIGINITKTGRFGVKRTSKPTSPKRAPEAPTAKVLKSEGKKVDERTKNNPAKSPEMI